MLLQAEGYEVECADSGEDAITRIHHTATAPGLVLADVQMPGLAGARLAGELRSFCPPETLLLVMSGSRPPDQILARFDGFLLKPFTMKEVADMLAEHNPPSSAKKPLVRREQWTVVPGPASRSPSNSRLVSIAASSAPQPHPRRRAQPTAAGPVRRDRPQRQIQRRARVERDDLSPACSFHARAAAPPDVRDVCLNDARERIASMRQLAASRDGAAFVRQAHAIKGGCGMLGATELHRMAAELEAHGLRSRCRRQRG